MVAIRGVGAVKNIYSSFFISVHINEVSFSVLIRFYHSWGDENKNIIIFTSRLFAMITDFLM